MGVRRSTAHNGDKGRAPRQMEQITQCHNGNNQPETTAQRIGSRVVWWNGGGMGCWGGRRLRLCASVPLSLPLCFPSVIWVLGQIWEGNFWGRSLLAAAPAQWLVQRLVGMRCAKPWSATKQGANHSFASAHPPSLLKHGRDGISLACQGAAAWMLVGVGGCTAVALSPIRRDRVLFPAANTRHCLNSAPSPFLRWCKACGFGADWSLDPWVPVCWTEHRSLVAVLVPAAWGRRVGGYSCPLPSHNHALPRQHVPPLSCLRVPAGGIVTPALGFFGFVCLLWCPFVCLRK